MACTKTSNTSTTTVIFSSSSRLFSIISIFLFIFCQSSLAQQQCSEIVQTDQIISDDLPGNVENIFLVNITFPVPYDWEGQWTVILETKSPFNYFGASGMWSTWDEKKAYFIGGQDGQKLSVAQEQQDQIFFQVHLGWNNFDDPIPQIGRIIWENVIICEDNNNNNNDIIEVVKNRRKLRRSKRDSASDSTTIETQGTSTSNTNKPIMPRRRRRY